MLDKLITGTTTRWLLRRILELGGAYLVTSGTLTSEEVQQAIGAVTLLIGLAWNVWSTFQPHATANGVKVPLPQLSEATQREIKRSTEDMVTGAGR